MRKGPTTKYTHTLGEICRDLHRELYQNISPKILAKIIIKNGYPVIPWKNRQKHNRYRYYYNPKEAIEYVEEYITKRCIKGGHSLYPLKVAQRKLNLKDMDIETHLFYKVAADDTVLRDIILYEFDLSFIWGYTGNFSFHYDNAERYVNNPKLFLLTYYWAQSYILIKRLKQEIKEWRIKHSKPQKLLKDSEILSLLR